MRRQGTALALFVRPDEPLRVWDFFPRRPATSQRAAPRAIGGTPQPRACGSIFFSLVPSRTHRVAFFRVHGAPRAVFGMCECAGPGAAAGRDRPRRDAQSAASHLSFDLAPRGRPGAPLGPPDGDSTVHTDELLAQEDFLLISMLGTPRARCFRCAQRAYCCFRTRRVRCRPCVAWAAGRAIVLWRRVGQRRTNEELAAGTTEVACP